MNEYLEIISNLTNGIFYIGLRLIPFVIIMLIVHILGFTILNKIKKSKYSNKVKVLLHTINIVSILFADILIASLVIWLY